MCGKECLESLHAVVLVAVFFVCVFSARCFLFVDFRFLGFLFGFFSDVSVPRRRTEREEAGPFFLNIKSWSVF